MQFKVLRDLIPISSEQASGRNMATRRPACSGLKPEELLAALPVPTEAGIIDAEVPRLLHRGDLPVPPRFLPLRLRN